MRRLTSLTLLLSALLCLLIPVRAAADDYPSRTVRIIISFPAGGSTDVLARQLADTLSRNLGQQVIVDNRPGGGFNIAADAAAKAPPDGYTIFMALDATFTLNPLIYAKLPYDPSRDFIPISLVGFESNSIVASAKAPFKTFKAMVAYAKAHPGKVTYGTSALLAELVGEELKRVTGTNMVHVMYRGSPDMLQALLSGDIDFSITGILPYATYAKDGKLVALATTGTKRVVLMPDAPTVGELGYPTVGFRNWFALFAPAGTPAPIVNKLRTEVTKALADPDLRKRLLAADLEPAAGTPAQISSLITNDRAHWAQIIKATGVKLAGE